MKHKTQLWQMGFTLTEMIITIAILGILAAFAIPNYQRYLDNTRLVQAKTVIAQVQQEVQRVKLRDGTLGVNDAAITTTINTILNGVGSYGVNRRKENDLDQYYNFAISVSHSRYFYEVTAKNTAKKGLFVDQVGNAYKCDSNAKVQAHDPSQCEKL